ncbi:MAG: hypothetical protein WDO70_07980 [Alphaproteobacteria bacterium]
MTHGSQKNTFSASCRFGGLFGPPQFFLLPPGFQMQSDDIRKPRAIWLIRSESRPIVQFQSQRSVGREYRLDWKIDAGRRFFSHMEARRLNSRNRSQAGINYRRELLYVEAALHGIIEQKNLCQNLNLRRGDGRT